MLAPTRRNLPREFCWREQFATSELPVALQSQQLSVFSVDAHVAGQSPCLTLCVTASFTSELEAGASRDGLGGCGPPVVLAEDRVQFPASVV